MPVHVQRQFEIDEKNQTAEFVFYQDGQEITRYELVNGKIVLAATAARDTDYGKMKKSFELLQSWINVMGRSEIDFLQNGPLEKLEIKDEGDSVTLVFLVDDDPIIQAIYDKETEVISMSARGEKQLYWEDFKGLNIAIFAYLEAIQQVK
jgi:hypothetical protein